MHGFFIKFKEEYKMRMRTGHSKRIISVVIALSLVLSMMSGLSLSVSAAEAVSVSTWSQLKAALESTADVNITVTDNIDFTALLFESLCQFYPIDFTVHTDIQNRNISSSLLHIFQQFFRL